MPQEAAGIPRGREDKDPIRRQMGGKGITGDIS